jgi:hypothetical protein
VEVSPHDELAHVGARGEAQHIIGQRGSAGVTSGRGDSAQGVEHIAAHPLVGIGPAHASSERVAETGQCGIGAAAELEKSQAPRGDAFSDQSKRADRSRRPNAAAGQGCSS